MARFQVAVHRMGTESGDSTGALVEFEAVPESALHIQLVWDHPTRDQDLHLVSVAQSSNHCHPQWDCYFANCNPTDYERVHWFPEVAVGEGPNPRLDRDDTNGLGPENINIDAPSPGTYRVYTHYWPIWEGAPGEVTVYTVRLYFNGILRFDEHRSLNSGQVWAVGDILWSADGSPRGQGTFSAYPSAEPGYVGSVGSGLTANRCPGPIDNGWHFSNVVCSDGSALDCAGVCGGTSVRDNCGTCDSDAGNDCPMDCNGVNNGPAVLDDCGVCEGDNSSCLDCAEVPNGVAFLDRCEKCVGGSTGEQPCEEDCSRE